MQGDFRSLMVVVTPCRSDLSPAGLSPGSHLADGRIRLVLVRRCSHLQYLGFLASIPRTGKQPSLIRHPAEILNTALTELGAN